MNIICEKEEADVPALASNSKTDEILDGANYRILDTIKKRRASCIAQDPPEFTGLFSSGAVQVSQV